MRPFSRHICAPLLKTRAVCSNASPRGGCFSFGWFLCVSSHVCCVSVNHWLFPSDGPSARSLLVDPVRAPFWWAQCALPSGGPSMCSLSMDQVGAPCWWTQCVLPSEGPSGCSAEIPTGPAIDFWASLCYSIGWFRLVCIFGTQPGLRFCAKLDPVRVVCTDF